MLLRSGAMTGGYGAEFDHIRVYLDDNASEDDSDDCTFHMTRTSFSAEDSEGSVVASLPEKSEDSPFCSGQVEVTPLPSVRMEVTPSPPGRTEVTPSPPGRMEVTPSPPMRMEVTSSPPGRVEITLSPPLKIEVTSSPPVKMEVNSTSPVKVVVNSTPPVEMVLNSTPPVEMVLNSTPPVEMVLNSTPPMEMEVNLTPPMRMETTSSPPVSMVAPPRPPARIEVTEPSTTVTLTPEQQQVLDYVRAGENVFFSGPGGTGKTVVLQEILKFFKRKFWREHSEILRLGHACDCFACSVAITAPTGIAAISICGSTIHRAAGIGVPRRPRDFNRMWHVPVRLKWRNLRVLIIDEISMVSAELLEYLEQTIRRIRTKEVNLPGKPFGGLQVIFAGDFFQLQPVEDKDTKTCIDVFLNRGLAFEARAWDRANFKTVILKRVFRQRDDRFVDLLNGIRTGENRAAVEEIFENCSKPLPVANGILPTVLYPTNVEVDQFNNEKLDGLKSKEVVLDAEEEILTNEGRKPEQERDEDLRQVQHKILDHADFWKECLAPMQIKLKGGAQVMLLRNLILEGNENDLVNGSRGILVGWKRREQVLDEFIDLQCDCATKLRNGSETNEEQRFRNRVEQNIDKLQKCPIDAIPLVRFINGRLIPCVPEKFSYEFLNVGECIRWQVPLKLAWALTIHKCQGMTLDYVIVNLQGVFAEGQVYVALSRARSMAGLQIVGSCSAKDVKVSQKVVEFYKALAAEEVPFLGKFSFPDMVFEIPLEEVLANARRKVDGRMVNGRPRMPPRLAEHLHDTCPEVLPETEFQSPPDLLVLPESTEKLS